MSEKTPEQELDALKADIAGLRDEIAGFTADLRRWTELKDGAHTDAGQGRMEPGRSDESGKAQSIWVELLRQLDVSRAQGDKVVKEIVSEVEEHPLAGIAAAFSLGFLVAKLWNKGGRQ